MKIPPLFICAALCFQAASAGEQCVTLGDSLTFAYEAEFGFSVSIPFLGTFGDGFGPEVRNWVEILNDPVYRNDRFDFGSRDEFEVSFFFTSYDLLFRHESNWALPGLKVEELRSYIAAESDFADMIAADPDLELLLSISDLDTETAFLLSDLVTQIQTTAERLVFFIGGNDLRAVYGDIYNGGPAGAFVADFISDSEAILDWVLGLNPDIQIVVVNVPHIGITPDIKSSYPTDPVATGRVTAVLRDLNSQLAGLAAARGLGYADVFTPTLSLLGPAPLCVQGIHFQNDGSTSGNLDYVWLNGRYSANFHPNTSAQALIANEIIDAFNTRYQSGIAPLTATEMLTGLLGKSAGEIDMPFAIWMECYALAGLPGTDDSDGDGIPAAVEFALGLNPTLRDGHKVVSSVVANGGSPMLELAYPIRLPVSANYSLTPEWSADLSSAFTPFPILPQPGSDGLARAWLPATNGKGFLRLQSIASP